MISLSSEKYFQSTITHALSKLGNANIKFAAGRPGKDFIKIETFRALEVMIISVAILISCTIQYIVYALSGNIKRPPCANWLR